MSKADRGTIWGMGGIGQSIINYPMGRPETTLLKGGGKNVAECSLIASSLSFFSNFSLNLKLRYLLRCLKFLSWNLNFSIEFKSDLVKFEIRNWLLEEGR